MVILLMPVSITSEKAAYGVNRVLSYCRLNTKT